jgi:hypothetical protein
VDIIRNRKKSWSDRGLRFSPPKAARYLSGTATIRSEVVRAGIGRFAVNCRRTDGVWDTSANHHQHSAALFAAETETLQIADNLTDRVLFIDSFAG